ncbi:BTAD domain-containing putative transcriptional regulator [Kitasatospora sp. NPDC056446]|uniref:BTAD domain-containing putative transcriptional regulator n=1 Tax=Kitasatospora sp. NPDC056446 TaxID=3345819 RepID=UPI0036B01559
MAERTSATGLPTASAEQGRAGRPDPTEDPTEEPDPFGPRLRSFRRRAGLSQETAAARAGMSTRALRDIEQGRVRRPRPRTLRQLAEALDLTGGEQADLLAAARTAPTPDADRPHLLILGPLALRHGRTPVPVTSPMLRRLLGLLALKHPGPATRQEITDVLWPAGPPGSHQGLVHTYVSQVRRLLAPDGPRTAPPPTVIRTPTGYLLEAPRSRTDLGHFDDLLARAGCVRHSPDPEAAYDTLSRALRWWRGPVLADADLVLREHPAAVAANERRTRAALLHADAALLLRRPAEAVPVLGELVGTEPLHEGLHARLIRALADSGEQAAALDVFGRLRARLDEELGIAPGPEVREAHLRVLRRQPPVTRRSGRPAPDPVPAPGRAPVPHPVPAPPPGPSGRTAPAARCHPPKPGPSAAPFSETARDVTVRGLVCWKLGRLHEAAEHFSRVARLFHGLDSTDEEAVSHTNLGVVHRALGRPRDTIRMLGETLPIHLGTGNRFSESVALNCLSGAYTDLGDHATGRLLAHTALAAAQALRDRALEAHALLALGAAQARAHDPADAADSYREALRRAEVADDRFPQAAALVGLAAIQAHREPRTALHTAERAVALSREAEFRMLEGCALDVVARVRVRLGESRTALEVGRDALALHRQTGHRPGEVRSQLALGYAQSALGARSKAFGHWREARRLSRAMGGVPIR